MAKILVIKDHRPKCKHCGHYQDEHVISFDDAYNCRGFVCQRVMEIKNGRPFYTCLCNKGNGE